MITTVLKYLPLGYMHCSGRLSLEILKETRNCKLTHQQRECDRKIEHKSPWMGGGECNVIGRLFCCCYCCYLKGK